ncbi:tRNA lysidine(34) synthetase TilS [Sediminitomix flava]|uniref:tRNA(Ile)-lysidine synthase n=1 Tax=Sediminitomix flava TaxID=379075 RepID=A0A315ZCQ7_SEDFL|nr:tRNA lysidine(34) synthetase TilS [Sediminitomix flava]PWJ42534.1 tRNA(Ile)-lysidine synthase [Sediminitomix flava]
MLQDFLTFINLKKLFSQEHRLLVAVSGGVDSVVLVHLLQMANFNFSIAHCNFSLRAEESDKDEKFVESLAEELNVPFHSIRFDTNSYAEKHQKSIQMAARDLRYDWFDKLVEEHQFDFLLTAHHTSDVLETMIFNLTKGTGIEGLHGILPQKDKLIRPLLFTDKDSLTAFAIQNNWKWREDQSNASNKYARNMIRNQVTPLLQKINPTVTLGIKETADRIRGVEKIFFREVERVKSQGIRWQGETFFFSLRTLVDYDTEEQETFLYYILREYGFSYAQIKQVVSVLEKHSGKEFFNEKYSLVKDRDFLVMTPKELGNDFELEISKELQNVKLSDEELTFEVLPKERWKLDTSPYIAALDYDRLTFPLRIRNWQAGEKMKPLGFKNRKKVSDVLTDLKVPRNLKQKVKVLESGGDICWVIGHRMDDRFKVKSETKTVLQIRLKKQ